MEIWPPFSSDDCSGTPTKKPCTNLYVKQIMQKIHICDGDSFGTFGFGWQLNSLVLREDPNENTGDG